MQKLLTVVAAIVDLFAWTLAALICVSAISGSKSCPYTLLVNLDVTPVEQIYVLSAVIAVPVLMVSFLVVLAPFVRFFIVGRFARLNGCLRWLGRWYLFVTLAMSGMMELSDYQVAHSSNCLRPPAKISG